MIANPDHVLGMPIVSNPRMADWKQYRFPRTKKRRTRKKWAKRPQNYRWSPWDRAYEINGVLYMHPTMIHRLKVACDAT